MIIDYNDVDEDYVLKDGEALRVPLLLMDSAPSNRAVRVDDNFAMQGHRPGYVVCTDAARSERIERQRSHDAELSNRWRSCSVVTTKTAATDNLASARARRDERLANRWRHR